MKNLSRILLLIALVALAAGAQKRRADGPIGQGRSTTGPISAKLQVVADLDARLAKYKTVRMPFNAAKLSARERRVVEKLVAASQYMESIYWRQSDPEALRLYAQLGGTTFPRDEKLRRFLFINGSRFDALDENKPFVGSEPASPGHGLFSRGIAKEHVEAYVKAHPDKKDAIYSGYTVVRRNGNDLEAIPYRVAYREFLEPAARLLREAAALSDDKAFANFLRLRADALVTDDMYKSDIAWIDLKDPKIDIVFGPYETYLDEILGVKTTYSAAVLIRNEEESRKLAMYQKYVPAIQQSLPLAPEDKPSKEGHATPMEVMEAPFRTGDFVHGYQSVATNLPNDPRIHAEKGTKKIFFKNFMDARVNYVILPLAKRMMVAEQAVKATGHGYMAGTLMHEIAHGIGPVRSRVDGKEIEIREALGPIYSALEETKADVVGMYGLVWLVEQGALPKRELDEYFASMLAGMFRSMRFGVGEAHGRAEMTEFNYYAERGGIIRDANGRYRYVADKLPDAIRAMMKELLDIEATGDAKRAEALFAKYDKMPAELQRELAKHNDIPVDITPVYDFPVRVR